MKKRRIRLLPIIMALIIWFAADLALNAALCYGKQRLEVGTVAEQDIVAPMQLQDEELTLRLQQSARDNTVPVEAYYSEIAQSSLKKLEAFFAGITAFRNVAEEQTDSQLSAGQDVVLWQAAIAEQKMLSLARQAGLDIDVQQGWDLLAASETDLYLLQEILQTNLSKWLFNSGVGLSESELPVARRRCEQELTNAQLSIALQDLGEVLIDQYLVVTRMVDEGATVQAQDAAAAAVSPAVIQKGEVIVSAGTQITQELWDKLDAWGLANSRQDEMRIYISNAILSLLLVGLFAVYCLWVAPSILENSKDILLLGILIIVTVLFAWICTLLHARMTPGLFAVILIAFLINKEIALAVNVMLSVLIGLMAGGKAAVLDSYSVVTMLVAMLIAGTVAVLLMRNNQKRGSLITAGVGAGIAAAVTVSLIHCITGQELLFIITDAAWLLGSYVIMAVLGVGTLVIWENLFDIATDARLNELSRVSHPLLKQLMLEAPGTYHHSLMAATLAESAAAEIGANPLLCRVSAYYHDVGKLKRPSYFMENQGSGPNIHDTLKPQESAAIIIAHVKDGTTLLNRYKMPREVIRIVQEHHGNSLVAYFYYKANGGKLDKAMEKMFRYPWNSPSTKESAIVMLADSCEAAVRSIQEPTPDAIRDMIWKVIRGKMDDGQLRRAPLTLRELENIQKKFYTTFLGAYHERIEYPQMKKEEGEGDG